MPSEDITFDYRFFICLSIHFNMSRENRSTRDQANAVLKSANARLSYNICFCQRLIRVEVNPTVNLISFDIAGIIAFMEYHPKTALGMPIHACAQFAWLHSKTLAGKWAETDESFHMEDAQDWVESDIKGEHNFALRVSGGSMVPEFDEGEITLVSPHAKATSGDNVVAKNDEEEATVKQYKRIDNT